MKYYLVGIKGTGMCSLATFLKDLGHTVIGSDTEEIYFTDTILNKKKIEVLVFNKNNITSDYIYIISNAYDTSNEEVAKIVLNDFEHYYYDLFIGSMLERKILSVSGTHGKTTTSSFLAQMFNDEASYIVGDGNGYGTNKTKYLVLESCEYKDHFLSYNPYITLVTNIDFDHPDYFNDIDMVINSFQKLINKSNIVIINKDDVNSSKLKHNKIISFGFDPYSDYVIKIKEETKDGYIIELTSNKFNFSHIYNITYKGYHMIYDFVGAIVIMLTLNLAPKTRNLKLPNRRMREYRCNELVIIDDYAHHPKEIKCLYESISKKYPGYKYNVIFQPHTYSRTISFIDDFISSLDLFDTIYIEKVFTSKREKRNKDLEEYVRNKFSKFNAFNLEVLELLDYNKQEVWVFLGAGVVNKYIFNILDKNKV